jgi:hypothetical protein
VLVRLEIGTIKVGKASCILVVEVVLDVTVVFFFQGNRVLLAGLEVALTVTLVGMKDLRVVVVVVAGNVVLKVVLMILFVVEAEVGILVVVVATVIVERSVVGGDVGMDVVLVGVVGKVVKTNFEVDSDCIEEITDEWFLDSSEIPDVVV